MKLKSFIILIFLLACFSTVLFAQVNQSSKFSVMNFGAIADGVTDNTKAFHCLNKDRLL